MVTESYPIILDEDVIETEKQMLASEEGNYMEPEQVKYAIIHCSATKCNRNYTAEQLLRDHRARGFITGGYHFYVRRSGETTQYRRLLQVGAHCRPWNRCSIGICYEGGLDEGGHPANTLTQEQYLRISDILKVLRKMFPSIEVRGHRDMPGTTPKECPCFDARSVFKESKT